MNANVKLRAIWMLTIGLLLAGCLPTTPYPTSTATATATATITPTATTVWFPPTETPSPVPTIERSPTPDLLPNFGASLLEDPFRSDAFWLTGAMGAGTIATGANELTLAVSQPNGYLFSFRNEPFFSDFYAEITASPSICAGLDEYGLLIRYNSPRDFYRFSLSCNGQTRLDKLLGGLPTAPQPWLVSPSVPTGAPSSSRLGVWAVGDELQFFINGDFQFAVRDYSLGGGMLGVFARSAGETALTVNFSDLVVYSVLE